MRNLLLRLNWNIVNFDVVKRNRQWPLKAERCAIVNSCTFFALLLSAEYGSIYIIKSIGRHAYQRQRETTWEKVKRSLFHKRVSANSWFMSLWLLRRIFYRKNAIRIQSDCVWRVRAGNGILPQSDNDDGRQSGKIEFFGQQLACTSSWRLIDGANFQVKLCLSCCDLLVCEKWARNYSQRWWYIELMKPFIFHRIAWTVKVQRKNPKWQIRLANCCLSAERCILYMKCLACNSITPYGCALSALIFHLIKPMILAECFNFEKSRLWFHVLIPFA